MIQVLTVIAPLFLIIFASAALQRWYHIGDHWFDVLNEYAAKIGLPVLIFSALIKTPFSLFDESRLIISNSLFILGIFLACFIFGTLFIRDKRMARTLFFCLVFGNIAYLGIPLLVQVFGDSILTQASLIVAIYFLWIFSVGIWYVRKNQDTAAQKHSVPFYKNPLLIAVFLGILISSFGLKMPAIIMTSLDMISASVTPTVLIVIGLFLGKSTLGRPRSWLGAFLFSCITLLILPALFYGGVLAAGFSVGLFATSLIQAAMPLAITPFALADEFDFDKDFIARSIVVSTLLSVLSLPFWISILT